MATTVEQYEARYAEAETALHALMTGSREEEVAGPDGRRTKYTAATLPQLQSYLAWLRQQMERVRGGYRKPILFGFGR